MTRLNPVLNIAPYFCTIKSDITIPSTPTPVPLFHYLHFSSLTLGFRQEFFTGRVYNQLLKGISQKYSFSNRLQALNNTFTV
jgi:hypothetical protein